MLIAGFIYSLDNLLVFALDRFVWLGVSIGLLVTYDKCSTPQLTS